MFKYYWNKFKSGIRNLGLFLVPFLAVGAMIALLILILKNQDNMLGIFLGVLLNLFFVVPLVVRVVYAIKDSLRKAKEFQEEEEEIQKESCE